MPVSRRSASAISRLSGAPSASSAMSSPLPNLYDLAPAELHAALGEVVSPPFRVRQIVEWLHERGVSLFEAMTNLPRELRARLAERFTVAFPEVVERTPAAADGSRKYLFQLPD